MGEEEKPLCRGKRGERLCGKEAKIRVDFLYYCQRCGLEALQMKTDRAICQELRKVGLDPHAIMRKAVKDRDEYRRAQQILR